MENTMAPLPALSVQLYSVRRELADDLPGSLEKLAGMGLTQVEPFDLVSDPEALRDALQANGLTAPTAHTKLTAGINDQDKIFEAAATVGVRTVIDPMIDPARWTSEDGVKGVADDLAAAAEKAAGYGLRIGYHNHSF